MLRNAPMKSMLISVFIPFRLSKNGLELWMQVRHEAGALNGFLEFPGGKIGPTESMKAAAIRELIEETDVLSVNSERVRAFKNYSHEYSDRKVSLFTFVGQIDYEELKGSGWHTINKENPLAGIEDKVLSANKEIISDLSRYFYEILEDKSWSELWPPL